MDKIPTDATLIAWAENRSHTISIRTEKVFPLETIHKKFVDCKVLVFAENLDRSWWCYKWPCALVADLRLAILQAYFNENEAPF